MDPKWQFVFYLGACVCWLIECMKFAYVERRWGALRVAIFGWVLFGIPFVVNALVDGW